MKYYNLFPFNISFITEVDGRLKDKYSKKLKREKFFQLYSLVERESSKHPEKTFRYVKARLKAEYLQDILGKYYQEYINISISANIINTDNHYIVGSKSKDYWIDLSFSNKIQHEELMKQEYITTDDNELYKEITKVHKEKSFSLKYRNIWKMLSKIEFDQVAAIKWLSNLVETNYFETDGKFNIGKYNVYQRMINDMADKKWVIVEDEKTGRIFHTFNLIKRELRNFCYVDGQKLVQSDLRSSQPYFLASRLVKENPNNENIKTFFNDVTTKDIYQLLLEEYIKLNGSANYNFYKLHSYKDENSNKLQYSETIEKTFKNRNDIKPEFLKVLYKGITGGAALLNVFKAKYPEVYKAINEAKKENKTDLPLSLQSDEANIFVNAYNEISQTTWALSVHDSIYVVENDKDEMIEVINKHFIQNGYTNYTLI